MPNCLSRPLRICEAWIRIRESSIFLGKTSAGPCGCSFPDPPKNNGERNSFRKIIQKKTSSSC
jgi:hypothetical protein